MNNKNKMKRLAIISLIVMGIMLVFAMFDAARMNRKLNELQKTVNYAQLFEEVLYPEMATAENAETAESAVAEDFSPTMNFVEGQDGVRLTQDSYLPLALDKVQVYVPASAPGSFLYKERRWENVMGWHRLRAVRLHEESCQVGFRGNTGTGAAAGPIPSWYSCRH